MVMLSAVLHFPAGHARYQGGFTAVAELNYILYGLFM